jgi:hypothetical protein
MPMLGIDQRLTLYYEGQISGGYGLWPAPVVTVAHFPASPAETLAPREVTGVPTSVYVFREDSFDPVSRIRRGRFHRRAPEASIEWCVQPHPAFREETGERVLPSGYLRKSLYSFNPHSVPVHTHAVRPAIVLLGVNDAATRWSIIDTERIATGEDLVTLKAASRMGILPELRSAALPDAHRVAIEACYEKAADAAYRFGAESVIDRCRDAASALLTGWIAASTGRSNVVEKDLAEACKGAAVQGKELASLAGQVIARLHARAKPSVQAKFNVSGPHEADAGIALGTLGLIARELGYSEQ